MSPDGLIATDIRQTVDTGMRARSILLRPGLPSDSLTVAALSVQVFLDTYATHGVRPDLAREALGEYSRQAFLARLCAPSRRFVLAEEQMALVGFVEVECRLGQAPVQGLRGVEVVRLYVQPQAQRSGVGTALLAQAEKIALSAQAPALWLTVWEENVRALSFYSRSGYADVGATVHAFEGRTYGNRVLAKRKLDSNDGACGLHGVHAPPLIRPDPT